MAWKRFPCKIVTGESTAGGNRGAEIDAAGGRRLCGTVAA
jgi:hypothetical protein